MMRHLLLSLWMVALVSPAWAKTYDKDYFGEMIVHKAVYEDTLIHLARGNNLGYVELRAANPGMDPWIPGAGARIVLPKKHLLPDAPREGIVINLSEMRLFYFKEPGEAPITYPISIGREGLSTPLGQTKVTRKKEGPQWRPTPRMRKEDPDLPAVVEPGPDNPLGTHALYLGWPQYMIHGTNKPYGIGRRVSSGCIRMYPEGIKELWPQVPVGTPVTVVDQPIKVGWIDDEMFIEVHPNQEQSMAIEEDRTLKSYEVTAEDMKRITAKAGDYAENIHWKKVREAVREHKGYPVSVLKKHRKPGSYVQDDLDELVEEAGADASDLKTTVSEAPERHIYNEPPSTILVDKIENEPRMHFNE